MKDFEKNLARLEEINEKIKDSAIPLEQSIALFEEGLSLAKKLENDLKKVEQKVEILINTNVTTGSDSDAGSEEEPEFGLFSS